MYIYISLSLYIYMYIYISHLYLSIYIYNIYIYLSCAGKRNLEEKRNGEEEYLWVGGGEKNNTSKK